MSADNNATIATETPPGAHGCSLQRMVRAQTSCVPSPKENAFCLKMMLKKDIDFQVEMREAPSV